MWVQVMEVFGLVYPWKLSRPTLSSPKGGESWSSESPSYFSGVTDQGYKLGQELNSTYLAPYPGPFLLLAVSSMETTPCYYLASRVTKLNDANRMVAYESSNYLICKRKGSFLLCSTPGITLSTEKHIGFWVSSALLSERRIMRVYHILGAGIVDNTDLVPALGA